MPRCIRKVNRPDTPTLLPRNSAGIPDIYPGGGQGGPGNGCRLKVPTREAEPSDVISICANVCSPRYLNMHHELRYTSVTKAV